MRITIKLRYYLIQLLVIALLACTNLQAGRPDRSPGVYIPVLKNTRAGEFPDTRWVSTAPGAYLEVSATREAAWQALEQAFVNLGIKPLSKDMSAGEWLTDWVVWKYDKDTGKAQSKPGISLKTQYLERHRFLFTLQPGDSADRVKIIARDSTRQREVDTTPDSEHTWMAWQDRDSQQAAADTFLQRLQLPIESALATRFVASGEIVTGHGGKAVVAETASRTEPDVELITLPEAAAVKAPPVQVLQAPVELPPAAPARPVVPLPPATAPPAVPSSVKEPAVLKKPVIPVTAPHKDAAGSSVAESTPAPPVQTREPPVVTKTMQEPEPDFLDLGPEELQATPAPESRQDMSGQTVVVPEPATNGLLVRAAPAATWAALQLSLNDLAISVEQMDDRQHTLLTGWVEANYDSKNQLLVMQSKDKPLWAFNLYGKGIERHRFQLVMVPANQGTRSIIYAYHTGSQQQVDLTPDSEQTILSWEDRETHADVALALLRQLRVIIPR